MGFNLYFLSFVICILNVQQKHCTDLEEIKKAVEVPGVYEDQTLQATINIIKLMQRLLTQSGDVFFKKEEIKELLGRNARVLKKDEVLKNNFLLIAGVEFALRIYQRKYPSHAEYLKSAVNIWRRIVDDTLSDKNIDKSSQEIYESLKKTQLGIVNEIAAEILEENGIENMEKEEYVELSCLILLKLSEEYDITMMNENERFLFIKLSHYFEDGKFDDVLDAYLRRIIVA